MLVNGCGRAPRSHSLSSRSCKYMNKPNSFPFCHPVPLNVLPACTNQPFTQPIATKNTKTPEKLCYHGCKDWNMFLSRMILIQAFNRTIKRIFSTGLTPKTSLASSNDKSHSSGIGSRANLVRNFRRRRGDTTSMCRMRAHGHIGP
jgi:hypothetical protein